MALVLIVALAVADLPNATLTPGSVATTDTTTVCRKGYAHAIRPKGAVWRDLRKQVLLRYGLPADAEGYTIDHLVPIEIGGAPADVRNLWPEAHDASKRKDRIEDRLHALVCSGQMGIRDAQARIERDWRVAVP